MLYFHTNVYKKKLEGIINAVDPKIGIKWPELITHRSLRDTKQRMLNDNYTGIELK